MYAVETVYAKVHVYTTTDRLKENYTPTNMWQIFA